MIRRLLVVLLLAASLRAQERSFRVPFHSVNGLILLDAGVNGKPAVKPLARGSVDMCEEHLAKSRKQERALLAPRPRISRPALTAKENREVNSGEAAR